MMKLKILVVLAILLSQISISTYSRTIIELPGQKEISYQNQLNTESKNESFFQNANLVFLGVTGLISLIMIGVIINFINLKKNLQNSFQVKDFELELSNLENELRGKEITNLQNLITSQQKERERIGNELHDFLGGMISSAKLNLTSINPENDFQSFPTVIEKFNRIETLLDDSFNQIWRLHKDITTSKKIGFNLSFIFKDYFEQIDGLNGIRFHYHESAIPTAIETDYAIIIYRIVRELVLNTILHSEAKSVSVQLTGNQKSIQILVEDDGKGFIQSKEKAKHWKGLRIVELDAMKLNGSVKIETKPKAGTLVVVNVEV
ncbi:sensor histidine kinase [Flexithrix dorotheae]|uniref:sensor histidine kinase n=1 Tax=Flexithrix dorotheae TaxID=70993 RepID=UPI0003AA4E24|nr:ATP-binding protein [Flexithrix dorotheae]